MCTHENCDLAVHSKGLCQKHYRQKLRRDRGLKKPGPKPKPGAVPHRKLTSEEKERRKQERRAAQTHCANNHEFTENNTSVLPSGQKVCKICTRASQQRYRGREVDLETPIRPRNADKTHCAQGHSYSEHGFKKVDGSRGCKRCVKAGRIAKSYGISMEQFEDELEKQDWKCLICTRKFESEPDAKIDHCHKTAGYRGLLCNDCNIGLGHFFDSPDLLRAAAAYLDRMDA